jgi:hypothetical protein
MNFLLSFWGLLVQEVDFWEVWRKVLYRHGDPHMVNVVSWVVAEVNKAGYEIPLRAVAKVFSSKLGVNPSMLVKEFVEEVKIRLAPTPCATEFLKWARGRGKVAILSNTPCRCFSAILPRVARHIGRCAYNF